MNVSASLSKLFRYKIDGTKPVNKGGCGHIWRATDLLFGKFVALKTIDETLLWDLNDTACRTFQKEAMAAARLGEISSHIIRVIDLGIIENTLYYAMEWIEPEAGYSTIDMSERAGRLSLIKVKALLLQVSEAVSTAHSQGIVHSDIAPHNIVFDTKSRLYKLSDFGLLKIIEQTLISHGSGSLLKGGRIDFFPEEVKSNISNLSYSSDVYALAVTFRVLLEGYCCLPSQGGALTSNTGVIRISQEQRDAPDQVRQLLARFIDRHTTTDSVSDFIEMLRSIPT